jgi:hypothetical protein
MNSIHRQLLAAPLVLLVVFGCGRTSQAPSSVSGRVTYKDKAIPSGTITFHRIGEEQAGVYPFPIKDGAYEGNGLVAEELIVTVETESANPKQKTPEYKQPGGKGQNPMSQYDKMMEQKGIKPASAANADRYMPIPRDYADKKKSSLRATLTKGRNELNFDLKD